MREEKFPLTRKPPSLVETGSGGVGGSFGATEESAATGVQRAKWRDSCTEDWCRPELTSLTCFSAHPPGRVGAGS